jgi:SAM-dependent methyltransferase
MPQTSIHVPDQLEYWNEWHRHRGATGEDPVHRALRDIFLRELVPGRGRAKVLDLGCGRGHDVAAFMNAGHRVWGVDFAVEALRGARRSLPRLRWLRRRRVKLVERDLVEPLPFPDESLDGIYSHLALQYFNDDLTRRIFREVLRVTRPGGLFVFSVKSIDDPYFGKGDQLAEYVYCRKGHVRHFFTPDHVQELLEDWTDVKIETCRGNYASPEQSVYVRAIAHKRRY